MRAEKNVNRPLKKAIETIKDKFALNQKDIADKLHITNSYLSEVINGYSPLTDSLIRNIYETFQIRIGEDEVKKESPDLLLQIKNLSDKCEEKERTIIILMEMVDDQKKRLEEKEATIRALRKSIEKLTEGLGGAKKDRLSG